MNIHQNCDYSVSFRLSSILPKLCIIIQYSTKIVIIQYSTKVEVKDGYYQSGTYCAF